MSCIFCKIVKGEIPCSKVYEDDLVLVFNDIDPQAPKHMLVIPKEHIGGAADINKGNSHVVARIFEVIADLSKSEGMLEGFRVVTNNGKDAGQSVDHLHFHLMGGRKFSWPAG
ncbi:MAG: histidine triad nucleotide-binding protein [Clostridiales bacterium]|nr:histidine triad nucleotide-binding protein [Clostridiales bacterium]